MPRGSSVGSASPSASSTTGGSVTAGPMSPTVGFPRDFWLDDWEKQAILDFHLQDPLEGYRRLTFRMLHRNLVASAPPASGGCSIRLAGWRVGSGGLRPRVPVSSSRFSPTSTGTSMFRISTFWARSTTCAVCSTVTAAPSSIGRSASR